MVSSYFIGSLKTILLVSFLSFSISVFCQNDSFNKPKSFFWQHVQFGGSVALSLGNNYSYTSIMPSAIYNFNHQFALGTGLQYSHESQKRVFTSNIYGISLLGLYNPLPNIQVSAELEEVNVNNFYQDINYSYKDNFWQTGLYLGLGYRSRNATVGLRYNVLFNKDRNLYGDAFTPFIRVYF